MLMRRSPNVDQQVCPSGCLAELQMKEADGDLWCSGTKACWPAVGCDIGYAMAGNLPAAHLMDQEQFLQTRRSFSVGKELRSCAGSAARVTSLLSRVLDKKLLA